MAMCELQKYSDGTNEHPTQALLDVGMLRQLLGDLDGKCIGLVGDPACRDFRSLLFLFALFAIGQVLLLPPPGCGFSEHQLQHLQTHNIRCGQVETVTELLTQADAICMLPIQLPSFHVSTVNPSDHRRPLGDAYKLTRDKLLHARRAIPILHVGPRGEELPQEVDDLPCVRYFDQIRFGLYLRAALLQTAMQDDSL